MQAAEVHHLQTRRKYWY